jgi:hypothetical protein
MRPPCFRLELWQHRSSQTFSTRPGRRANGGVRSRLTAEASDGFTMVIHHRLHILAIELRAVQFFELLRLGV